MKKFQNFQTEQLLDAIYKNFGNLQDSVEFLGFKRSKSNARALILELRKRNVFIDSDKIKQELIRKQYYSNPNKCKFCGCVIPFDQKEKTFCNSSCSASFNNTNRKRTFKVKFEKQNDNLSICDNNKNNNILSIYSNAEDKYCLNCGNLLKNFKNSFCCNSCHQEYQYNQWIQKWKSGEIEGRKGKYGISSRIRKYLFDKYNCKCQNCGWSETNFYTNTIPLEIHHIDGNYQNNSEDNLQLLCPNCHSLTETYKSHNKLGRKERKKYTE